MSSVFRRFISVVFSLCLLLGGLRVQPAKSAGEWFFEVNSPEDLNDFVTNSVCSVGAITGGPCTLRAAIAEANAIADTFNVTIYIPAGFYQLTISPEGINDIRSGDLDFPAANPDYTIKLVGTGAQPSTIDAGQLDRVFEIGPNVNVEMENIVIRSGYLSWTGTIDYPDGAGILNYGNLRLTHVEMEENIARCGQANCDSLLIGGGAIMNLGGSIRMQDSTIRNNVSVNGSAIFNTGDTGYFFIKNSTISDNHASEAFTITNYAYMHIRNSTISGNTAFPDYIVGINNQKTLILESSTIANAGRSSSIYNASTGSVTIHDSILKNIPAGDSGNCENSGTWVSTGYNIFSDNTCPLTGTDDLANTDPLLGSLGYYGGPTKTLPLLAGSPALDHRPGKCTNVSEFPAVPPYPLTEDQRHFGRADGKCDTGAFEWSKVFLPIILK